MPDYFVVSTAKCTGIETNSILNNFHSTSQGQVQSSAVQNQTLEPCSPSINIWAINVKNIAQICRLDKLARFDSFTSFDSGVSTDYLSFY